MESSSVSLSNHTQSQGRAFEILAKALPSIIKAREQHPIIELNMPGQMGKIADQIAEHLGVELCSIFLLETDDDNKQRLVLAEACGYDNTAIGTEKSMEEGITATISGLSNNSDLAGAKEVICNFTVQDHKAWTGELDGKIKAGHGWTLLGMPIMDAEGKKAKGVIKLENKKSPCHSDHAKDFLTSTAIRVNTPKTIRADVDSLKEEADVLKLEGRKCPFHLNSRQSGLIMQIQRIASELGEVCGNMTRDLPFKVTGPQDPPNSLDESQQDDSMQKISLLTSCLISSLDILEDSLAGVARRQSLLLPINLRGNPMLTCSSFTDTSASSRLITQLKRKGSDSLSNLLWSQFTEVERHALDAIDEQGARKQQSLMIEKINAVLKDPAISYTHFMKEGEEDSTTTSMLKQCSECEHSGNGPCMIRLKRLLLEARYPNEIAPNMIRHQVEAFSLALRAYTPFSRADIYLVRAVTAMIAAAINVSQNNGMDALRQLQHGLRRGTRLFLETIRAVTAEASKLPSEHADVLRDNLPKLWKYALNISGPTDAFGTVGREIRNTTFGKFLERGFCGRLDDYGQCAHAWGKELQKPQDGIGDWGSLGPRLMVRSQYLILGVSDIVFLNAVEWSGKQVRIRLTIDDDVALILFEDDGKGIDEETVRLLEGLKADSPRPDGYGLAVARYTLLRQGCDLLVLGNRPRDAWTCVGISIPLE